MSSNLDEGVDSSDTSYVPLCSLVCSSAHFFVLPMCVCVWCVFYY